LRQCSGFLYKWVCQEVHSSKAFTQPPKGLRIGSLDVLLSTYMSQNPTIRMGERLTIGYGKPLAGCDRELSLEAGTHYLLARNGRGKTTLLRTLSGTLRPVAGSFEIDGHIHYMAEDLSFDKDLPAATIFRAMLPGKHRRAAFDLADEIELDLGKPYGKLSTGNRRKVSLVLAEYSIRDGHGEVLFLDEPFSGLDATCREIFEKRWRETNDRTLRLVSCHPDYDRMSISSALLIHHDKIHHLTGSEQSWQDLCSLLN
jgi:ABC-type multidrug transport system ATPase subunit